MDNLKEYIVDIMGEDARVKDHLKSVCYDNGTLTVIIDMEKMEYSLYSNIIANEIKWACTKILNIYFSDFKVLICRPSASDSYEKLLKEYKY